MAQVKLYFEDTLPTGGASIPAGIHDKGNVMFSGLVKESNWWDLRFKNKNGQFARKRLFQPEARWMDEGETPSEALKRAEDRNIATVAAVMRALMGEQVGEMEFDEYEEFMNLAASALQPFEGTPVCLKVLPDKKNTKYTTIPDRRFIDTFVEGFPTNLRFSKKELELIEQVEKAVE